MIKSLIGDNGSDVIQGNDLAEHVNNYFANVGINLAENIAANTVPTSSLLYHTVLNNNRDNVLYSLITEEEITKVINDIDVTKSSSMDNIRSMVIIDAFKSQLPRLVKLYNGSLTRCSFPAGWKRGTIIPLPKISNPNAANDMRPIALLPLPGKIMEHIISNRLKNYLHENNILTEKQHGFRKKRSTISAVMEFLNIVYNNINDNHDSYIIFLDLKKAFDTVCHKLLLNKLKNIGLRNRTVDWFRSYLSDRVQRTRMNDQCSSYLPVPFGVPQGSILGRHFFPYILMILSTL